MMTQKVAINRLAKAVAYLYGLVDALDSEAVPQADKDLELILKGKKSSVEQDSKTLKSILKELGIKP